MISPPSVNSNDSTNDSVICPDEYYLGIQIGPTQLGWAVTDQEYNILKCRGKSTWGIHLFDRAESADTRRMYRHTRRRLQRRKWRLSILRGLFRKAICDSYPDFFDCLENGGVDSFLDDKFPTVFHLRKHLMSTSDDVRFLYVACYHIIKHRGNFSYSTFESDISPTFDRILSDMLRDFESCGVSIRIGEGLEQVLLDQTLTVSERKRSVSRLLQSDDNLVDKAICNLLSGASGNISPIFKLDSKESIQFGVRNTSDRMAELVHVLDESQYRILERIKIVHDWSSVHRMMSGHQCISDFMIHQYDMHRNDLAQLKSAVRTYVPDGYHRMFRSNYIKGNYCSYSGHSDTERPLKSCDQETFCRYCESFFSNTGLFDDAQYVSMVSRIKNRTFMPKQISRENYSIPSMMHRVELSRILDVAVSKHPFLLEVDGDGISVKEKIIQLYDFRIPYYVGPLGAGTGSWAVRRSDERIYPWNFESVVDVDATMEAFINTRINDCSYLIGEKVLPLHSVIYSYYMVCDELNKIRIDGAHLPLDLKHEIIRDLLIDGTNEITRESIQERLFDHGYVPLGHKVSISGMGARFKTSFRGLQAIRSVLGDKVCNIELCEDIIRIITVFNNPERISSKLSKDYSHILSEEEIQELSILNLNGWSNVSKRFLTGLYDDTNGKNIIQLLGDTNETFDEIYNFRSFHELVKKHNAQFVSSSDLSYSSLDRYGLSPAKKRSLWRSLVIIRDIVDNIGTVPKRIFVDIIDEHDFVRKDFFRKEYLINAYTRANEDERWTSLLKRCSESDLKNRNLFLYFTQLGRCIYCGKELNLECAEKDHIIPRSKVYDDDMYDNLVLSCKQCNGDKGDFYPISMRVRVSMIGFWKELLSKRYITVEKYERLTRTTQLNESELAKFIGKWSPSSNALYNSLSEQIRINFSKDTDVVMVNGKIISDMRQRVKSYKSRTVNDLHYAKDAYLSIVVGNVHLTKFTADPFYVLREGECYNMGKLYDRVVARDGYVAWRPGDDGSISIIKRYIRRDDILFTKHLRLNKGALFDDNPLRKNNSLFDKKRHLPSSDYGGYNNVRGACYSLIEFISKGHKIRSLEVLYVHELGLLSDKNDLKNLFSERKGTDVDVIVPVIRMGSLIEWDGFPLHIGGRTNDYIVYSSALQMLLPDDMYEYCRSISRLTLDKEHGVMRPLEYYSLSVEKNRELYDHLFDKCSRPPYNIVAGPLRRNLSIVRDRFLDSDVGVQAEVLDEILHSFKCDTSFTRLRVIGGVGSTGRIILNNKLPKCIGGIYLVNQSPSGLRENKIRMDIGGRV